MLHGDAVLEASVLDGRGRGAERIAILVPVFLACLVAFRSTALAVWRKYFRDVVIPCECHLITHKKHAQGPVPIAVTCSGSIMCRVLGSHEP